MQDLFLERQYVGRAFLKELSSALVQNLVDPAGRAISEENYVPENGGGVSSSG